MLRRPAEVVISSLDFDFPDEEGSEREGEEQETADPDPGEGDGGSATQPIDGASNGVIKGRNTPATIVRPAGPRASKMNALAAIARNSTSPLPATARGIPAPPPVLPRAPRLDFDTLRTQAPHFPNPPPRPSSVPKRLFGLEHAPVFHPSVDEFANPMEYIERIAQDAKSYGICKIVPPEGWRPPFALDTETFRFKTRLQLLNSMEASARASLNFLEQLYIFHRQQGSSGIAVPNIGGRPLDLWRLKREVTTLGGYNAVSNGRKWAVVAKIMGYNVQLNTAVCSHIKTAYLKIVVPFEDYVKRVKLAGGTPPPDPTILHDDFPSEQELSNGADSLATPCPEVDGPGPLGGRAGEVGVNEKVRTASDKLNEVLYVDGSSRSACLSQDSINAGGLLPSIQKKVVDDTPGEVCEICTMDHHPDKIVLCDGCDRGYHLDCLSPPLSEVPTSEFFCDTCLFLKGAEYGFEEGQEHSLHSFRRRADAFKRKWLSDHPMASRGSAEEPQDFLEEQVAIEDHFEREFWRLVESQTESVEIEYGADVNSTPDAGGFPSLKVHPTDPYSSDGWNLNNLPILAGSLLRYIKSDISGMTIPWIYVGMVFSTFAWHKEDHYTYSINYHHWGDTKTWYGIPGMDDDKLEAAMKLAAPELFDQQPDLMFQLVTLMSPGRLQKHGVRVVACDQRPNEFVITFPRSYHSGFNHGFNFNEAVNFALPDWLPIGLQCVNRYRDIKKNPVFSHDELLITISQYERSPESSRWLLPNWREMVERELTSRGKFRRRCPNTPEVVDTSEIEEEDYQCEECRGLAYLSQALGGDGDEGHAVSCLDHFSKLDGGPTLLRLRYTDAELRSMLATVHTSALAPPSDAALIKMEEVTPDVSIDLMEVVIPDVSTLDRKRKSDVTSLECAGEGSVPPSQRIKLEPPQSAYGDESEWDDEEEEQQVAQALLAPNTWQYSQMHQAPLPLVGSYTTYDKQSSREHSSQYFPSSPPPSLPRPKPWCHLPSSAGFTSPSHPSPYGPPMRSVMSAYSP